MKFADLTPGRVTELGPVTLTADEIVEFARAYDPQWFHTDAERTAASHWGGLIASGWQTCGVAMRLVVDNVLGDSESFASPGLEYLKWPNPVRPGDPLRLRIEVLDSRRSQSRPTLGIVQWRWHLFDSSGGEVLDLAARNQLQHPVLVQHQSR
jgi:acyl dehydratase